MVRLECECGATAEVPESRLSQPMQCECCGCNIVCVSGDGVGAMTEGGDYSARLIVREGPSEAGRCLLLGGASPIGIGKLPANQVVLPGKLVSRAHCQLVRIDHDRPNWAIEDRGSTNGLFVNGERVGEKVLASGDQIRIGEYELEYRLPQEEPPLAVISESEALSETPVAPAAVARETSGPLCPSCERHLAPGARICTDCGIHVDTGRPILTSQDLDENVVYGNAETVIRGVSWVMPFTPMPIPLASEAFGTCKPYVIRTIAILTILASIIFFFAYMAEENGGAARFMLWPPNPDYSRLVEELLQDPDVRAELAEELPPQPRRRDARARQAAEQELREQLTSVIQRHQQPFHWWQLLTHAFLHDPDSIFGLVLHLGGNMLFLMVFGSRVNALIGNAATLVVYPLLAAAAAAAHLYFLPAEHMGPMLGASGVVNGLAGMYLILFPVHRVYCAMWIRLGLWFRFQLYAKVFTLRGFWFLLLYFAFDALMIVLDAQSDTAHWAHVGGFGAGVLLGLAVLLSRQFNCRNGDLLSVLLGRHVWPLIGRPSRWVLPSPA